MEALEYHTRVKDGKVLVETPSLAEDEAVRVIIERVSTIRKFDRVKFEKDLKAFQSTNPFKDIEDPVEWQRKIRDEWERTF